MPLLTKYHSLGNDYWVLNPKDAPDVPTAEWIKKLCHRHYGLGSDGLLYGPIGNTLSLRIFNPDGSEAEKSGNGCRIFAKYLYEQGLVKENHTFSLSTLGGLVNVTLTHKGQTAAVDMGAVSFLSDAIPMTGAQRNVLNETLIVNNTPILISAATIGNPHCVHFSPTLPTPDQIKTLGPLIENHPCFPNRTNFQLAYIQNKKTIILEIWERGAGYTLASGSSASAVSAIAYQLGYVASDVTVKMPGGDLNVHIHPDFTVTQTGDVFFIGTALYPA